MALKTQEIIDTNTQIQRLSQEDATVEVSSELESLSVLPNFMDYQAQVIQNDLVIKRQERLEFEPVVGARSPKRG